jgi:hypothetical protein
VVYDEPVKPLQEEPKRVELKAVLPFPFAVYEPVKP